MILLCPGGQIILALAVAEITERFACRASLPEIDHQRHQRRDDFRCRHEVLVHKIQPIADQSPSQKQRVSAHGLADQAEGFDWREL